MIQDGVALSEQLFERRLDPRAYLLAFYPPLEGIIPPLDHVVLTAQPATARINHGLWIWHCECGARTDLERGKVGPGGVVFLSGEGALLGWCPRCRNGATGRGWRPIAVPSEEERARIEAVLLCRPNVGDRNWIADESLTDLIDQNREHGDPLPEAA